MEEKRRSRGQKTICISFDSEEHYQQCLENKDFFREHIIKWYQVHPEIFPQEFGQNFSFCGCYFSKKQSIFIERIRINGSNDTYQLRPSFLMPYMVARTDEVEKALFLRRWGVSFDALGYVFERDSMFFYRLFNSMGRPSIVGSTVKSVAKLPVHLVADEKHTKLKGDKVFIPTTVASGCILGASIVTSASTDDLEKGYGEFADEAKHLDPCYSPETVCADGWQCTWDAWKKLFCSIVVILCFLHSVIKLKKCRTSDETLRYDTIKKVWDAYKAKTKASFSQRLRRLEQWTKNNLLQGPLRENVLKLCAKRDAFKKAYDFILPYRTSNGVDRLMDHQDRILYSMRYFHGELSSARLSVRAIAMLWNFHPYGFRTYSNDTSRISPFVDLNGFEYHSNWLHNFLIASSLTERFRSR